MSSVIIGAPFGLYFQPKDCLHTLGTFTVKNRGGPMAAGTNWTYH